MTTEEELAQINTMIESARRDLFNGRQEARDVIKRLQTHRMAVNDRLVDEIAAGFNLPKT